MQQAELLGQGVVRDILPSAMSAASQETEQAVGHCECWEEGTREHET